MVRVPHQQILQCLTAVAWLEQSVPPVLSTPQVRMTTFTTPLLQVGAVTISVHIASESSDHAVAVGQLGTQISISQDLIRQSILDSLAPYNQEQQPAPQTQSKPEPAAEPVAGPGQPLPAPTRERNGVSRMRLDRANIAGQAAGQQLRNQCVSVPATPRPPVGTPTNKLFVVLRSSDGTGAAIYQSWKQCKEHVVTRANGLPEIDPEAVFHGFACMTEIQSYCEGASVEVPIVWTRMN